MSARHGNMEMIDKLGDAIASLTLTQAKELIRYLDHFYGDPMSSGIPINRPPGSDEGFTKLKIELIDTEGRRVSA